MIPGSSLEAVLDASRRQGKKCLKYFRDKNACQGKNRSGEEGGGGCYDSDPGSEFRLFIYRRERK